MVDGEEITRISKHFFICAKLKGNDINRTFLEKCKGIYISSESVVNWWNGDEGGNRQIDDFFLKDSDEFGRNEKKWIVREHLYDYISNCEEIYFYLNVNRDEDGESSENKFIKTFGLIIKKDNQYYRGWAVNSDFRDAILTSAIIPAFRDPNSQFKINQWSWYGKLIRNIWNKKDSSIEEQINKKIEEIKELSDRVFYDATADIKEKLSEAIHHNKVNFQLMPNTKDDIYKGVNLFVDDGFESLASDKGSGIQSALIISLFSYYCSQFHKNSSLLAIEEPELYLHPHARRVMSSKFDEFVNQNPLIENQVIIATHSPEFLRNTEIENITVVRKPDTSNQTVIKRVNLNDTAKELQKIKQLLWSKNAEVFFADKAILVEGGEEYILPLIADHVLDKENSLDYHNISVVKVGGKSQFKIYLKLLRDLEIDTFVVADFDYFTNGIESIKDFIIGYLPETFSKVKKHLQQEVNGGNSDIYRNNKEIKKKLGSGDGKELCKIIDIMCQTGTYDERIEVLWDKFRPKVMKKINYTDFESATETKKMVDALFGELKESGIFIMKYGELEDYMTKTAEDYLEDQGVSGKELSVLKLTEAIASNEYSVEDFFRIDEYSDVIKSVVKINKFDKIRDFELV